MAVGARYPLRTLADARPGDHACQIYGADGERDEAAAAFLSAAAGKGEGAFLVADGIRLRPADGEGPVRSLESRAAFFPEGTFSPATAFAFLRDETARALASGASGIRVAVDAGWVQRAVPGAERFLEFEAGLRDALAGVPCSVLCQYDRRRFDPAELLNVVASHPLMVIGNNLVDNFYFVPQEKLGVTDFLGSILDQWIENLAGRTRVRQAEQDRTRLAMAVEQSGEAMVLFDLSGEAHYVNPAFERITGFRSDEVAGTRAVPLSEDGEAERARTREIRNALSMGLSWSGRITSRRKDGVPVELDTVVSTIREGDGGAVGSVAVMRDVTAGRRMEEELRQSQKMEAVGRLAGGVAHDFNNLLTAITGYAELLRERAGDGAGPGKEVEEILRAAERGSDLTRQLLAFGRKQPLRSRPVEVNGIVSGLEKMLRRLIGEDVELSVSLSPSPAVVMGDPGQLEQVLLNLVVNARDAMPAGGRLEIAVAPACPASSARGESVLLTVADTGCGMDDETKARIFEPFFTTKAEGKGTGLGLSTVYGIVHQFGGTVEVESSPGRGASFRVDLPAWSGEGPAAEAAEAAAPAGLGRETLLLVEDEDQVRSLVRRVLQGRGYRVFEAATPAEAIRLCEAVPGEIHLVLVDVVLPQTGGKKLAEHLRLIRPRMKVLFMSGYADDRLVGQGLLGEGMPFLQKPFTAEVLTRAVRGTLDGDGDALGGARATPLQPPSDSR